MIVVVLPSMGAVTAGALVNRRAWTELRTASSAWVGTVALNALQEDLVVAVDSLAAAALPTPVAPEDPAWARGSGGDTVSALRPRGSGAEVMVLTAPRPGDPPGSLRFAGAPLPVAPLTIAQVTASRLTLYLNGRRALATPDPIGPDTLPRETLLALSAAPGGLAMAGGNGGALVALDRPPGLPPSVAVMVEPVSPSGPSLPLPLLLVVGLLFVFACLAGWIQLGGDAEVGRDRRRSVLVVAAVPILAAFGFLVQADRSFEAAARTGATRDLARALAVARVRNVADSAALVHELTGFHATRIRDGHVEETTLAGPPEALATLPSPPPSFTSSGTLATPDGTSFYAALRLQGGGFVVVSARRPDDRIDAFRKALLVVAGVLGAWLAVGGWMAGVGIRRSDGGQP